VQTRKQRCFPTKQDYESGLSADEKQELVTGKVIDQTELVLPLHDLGHYWHY
jgi:hypothetical protein